jgi:predicted small secreted protein
MRLLLLAAPALLLAGCSTVQGDGPPDPRDAGAKAPAVGFSSAFERYRPFVEQEMQDWRRANEEVGAAGGHGAHQ